MKDAPFRCSEQAERVALATGLNIGCGYNKSTEPGWVNLDCSPHVEPEVLFDLAEISNFGEKLPFRENQFSHMLMSHVIEHLPQPLPIMQELWRVAAPGCQLIIRVPYGSSDIAFEDPTHYRQYFLNSFSYFGQPAYARADYGYRGDWKERERLLVLDPRFPEDDIPDDPRDMMQIVNTFRNVIDEFIVVLEAVKPMRQPEASSGIPRVPVRFATRAQMNAKIDELRDHG